MAQAYVVGNRPVELGGHAIEGVGQAGKFGGAVFGQAGVEFALTGAVEGGHYGGQRFERAVEGQPAAGKQAGEGKQRASGGRSEVVPQIDDGAGCVGLQAEGE